MKEGKDRLCTTTSLSIYIAPRNRYDGVTTMEELRPTESGPFKGLHAMVRDARKNVADAFLTSDPERQETWVGCFSDYASNIEFELSFLSRGHAMTPEQNRQVRPEMGRLRKRLEELAKQYPKRKTVPSKDVQDELFELLNHLLHTIEIVE